jgi:hypothetical protein
MKKLLIAIYVVAMLVLISPPHVYAAPVLERTAVATVTQHITGSTGNWTYTYTLYNSDSKAIWWWGLWFQRDPDAVTRSNSKTGWAFSGTEGYEGPDGEAALIYTWDSAWNGTSGGWTTITSPNAIQPGQTNVFRFKSSTLFSGEKNFLYDTVAYWNEGASFEAGGKTGIVPLPAAVFLLGSGLVGLLGLRRKIS